MDILVLGSNGQVGNALISVLGDKHNVSFLNRKLLDVTNFEKLNKYFSKKKFDFVFNAIAYTDVDDAENNRELCKLTNDNLTLELAHLSVKNNFKLIHYSTDYVFNGKKISKYTENDFTSPLNHYGYTKLSGENNIINNCNDYLILRVSGVYSNHKNNFLFKIKEKLYKEKEIYVVEDQVVNQTPATFIAELSKSCIENFNLFNKNIVNLVPSSALSWYEFAKLIKEKYSVKDKINCSIKPIMTKELNQIARRPLNSALDNSKIKAMLNVTIDNVEDYFMREII